MKWKLIGRNDLFAPIETVLENRGIPKDLFELDKSVIEDYNNYDNIEQGIELLLSHLDSNSKIEIIGDSDVDGMTSLAILYNYIKELYPKSNLNILIHTGKQHGLSEDINISNDTKLVILPDSSSNDYVQHKKLKNKGVDVLILDHHEVDKGYSQYAIVINNQLSSNVKNKNLCGAGVTYKFIKAMDDYLFEDKSSKYLDLVALGNVADMMDLNAKETRYFVYEGIKNINNTFLQALMEVNKFDLDGKYNIDKIGWVIAPKLNGTIRSGTQQEKLNMFKAFTSNDYNECLEVAKMCKNVKTRQDNAVKSAMNNILKTFVVKDEDRCIILEVGSKLNQSHTGLVAQKLMDKYKLPVLLYRIKDNIASGSGRGIESITVDFREDLLNSNLMNMCQGHASAFGFSIDIDNIPKLKSYLNELYKNKEVVNSKEYQVDFILNEDDVDSYIIDQLSTLENEWGNGIDAPLLAFENIQLYLTREDNLKGKLNIVFDINGVKFIKKFSTNILKESVLDIPVEVNIIGKCTVDTYSNCGQVEIVDIEILE